MVTLISYTRDPCLFLSSFVYTYTYVEQEPSIPDMNKELRIRNIYVDYFCWWYDLHVCGAHSAHYLHARCWRTTPNEVYHYLPGSDFYTSVTRDLCNVLLHFTPFEICSRWTKSSHPNHIAWNVMILSDDNVNWLFLYFFLRGERCNSDVNTVNGNN